MEIDIDASDLQRLVQAAGAASGVVQQELTTAVTAIGLDAERDAKRAAPVDRGQLRRSITSVVSATSDGAQAKVGTNVDQGSGVWQYARVVEFGRRPGGPMPPVDAIAGWLRRRGSSAPAYVVARNIARRGTRPQPYLIPAVRGAVQRSKPHLQAAVRRITSRFGSA